MMKNNRRSGVGNMQEIVISGVSGVFADSKNINQLCFNLYNKVDMITAENNRWNVEHPLLPKRAGKLPDLEKFDAGFFGVHYQEAMAVDPMVRILLEKAVEAIFDGGVHSSELEGTDTGVFIGAGFSETETVMFNNNPKRQNLPLTGLGRSMIAHRISYYLKLKGPSFNFDAGCSSVLYALEAASRAMRNGTCNKALVGGINLCLLPQCTIQFYRLGVLSLDGKCKTFDATGNGYVRSESAGMVLLQNVNEARRVYSTLIHIKSNCDGFKQRGINFPSTEAQHSLLEEIYQECQLDFNGLSYVETHGTGTQAGDPEEAAALDKAICSKRNKPLLIGSVKSNLGHCEISSGFSSLIKVIITLESGKIPPNLHFVEPRKDIEALQNGKLKVVVDSTTLSDNGIIGINNFGFGGANAHVILKRNEKDKINGGLPEDDFPRLVCVSGRSADSVTLILNDLKSRDMDAEYIRLYHQLFSKNISGHYCRGFSILSKSGEITRSVRKFHTNEQPLILVFGNTQHIWYNIAKELRDLLTFRSSIDRIHHILMKRDINIKKLILDRNETSTYFERLLSVSTIQIAMIEILKLINIKIDNFFGDRFESFFRDYIKGVLTLEETVSLVYDEAIQDTNSVVVHKVVRLNISSDTKQDELIILQFCDCNVQILEKAKICNYGKCENGNYFVAFLEALGSLYTYGVNFDVSKIYPEVQYPVSRSTPMISPLIQWDHRQDWHVVKSNNVDTLTEINFSHDDWNYIWGHNIDSRNLFPATSFLVLVYELFSKTHQKPGSNAKIVFENCKFLRAVNIISKNELKLHTRIQKGSGRFEVLENDQIVASGRIYQSKEVEERHINFENYVCSSEVVMKSEDVYKELRLRGYNYKGEFRKIVEFRTETASGLIKWNQNLVTFLDNMLQMIILNVDSRLLYVPVSIKRLYIDSSKGNFFTKNSGSNPVTVPVHYNRNTSSVICNGIEIHGVRVSSIARKKVLHDPILEKYEFVPNETELEIIQSLEVNMQIILENSPIIKMKIVEVMDGDTNQDVLGPSIYEILSKIPEVQVQITILTTQNLYFPNIAVVDKPLISESDCCVIVGTNLISNSDLREDAFKALRANGYVLSRENLDIDLSKYQKINIITVHRAKTVKLVLFKKYKKQKISEIINVSDEKGFTWLPILKTSLKNKENIIIYSQNMSGILGLTNCLRREPGGLNVKCFLVFGDAPPFNLQNPFYDKQLKKNMVINILKGNKWGTYRHTLLKDVKEVMREHCYVNTTVRGDLSSIKWLEAPLRQQTSGELVHVYYAALNSIDVRLATNRLNSKSVECIDRMKEECALGFEYSGKTTCGRRVMGMATNEALGTLLIADPNMMWDVPEAWSLEDASTVPVIYGTVLYAFFIRSKLQRGSNILIHSGANGFGQAAINVALYYGCKIFTTVNTKEEREFVKETFQQLKDHQIGFSKDTSFENLVYKGTNGRGVDFVLNSLVGAKLQASLRCLAHGGTFLEIGGSDFINDNELQLLILEKGVSLLGIELEGILNVNEIRKQELKQLLYDGIKLGFVRPVVRTVFEEDNVTQAFRYVTTEKYIGRILIKLRDEEADEPVASIPRMKTGVSRYLCNSNATYIIIGGLGGFGLELVDWLVLRGARKLILNSRKGICNGYQHYRIRIWNSYGAKIIVSTTDVTTRGGCEELIERANQLGPVKALFNLAIILKDSLLENQTEETFKACFEPKAYATEYLDQITRQSCPYLRDFVVFSSISPARGVGGQTNYGMANSTMERICENRKLDGYSALAIQWGPIGDVGIVADMQENPETLTEIRGTLQQPISSCLRVLDILLNQEHPVVSSTVAASKYEGDSLVDMVARILGIRDLKTISLHSSFSELGMDSVTSVEVQQILEREFQISLSLEELRTLTFSMLQDMDDTSEEFSDDNIKYEYWKHMNKSSGMKIDTSTIRMPLVPLLSSADKQLLGIKLIAFPGIEGVGKTLESLSRNLNVEVLSLQYSYDNPERTMKELVEYALPHVKSSIPKSKPFNLIGYSFGAVLALEVVYALEKVGYQGNVFLVDGAPEMCHQLFNKMFSDEKGTQTNFLCAALSAYFSSEKINKSLEKIFSAKSLEEGLDLIGRISQKDVTVSLDYLKGLISGVYIRMYLARSYVPSLRIRSNVVLYKPTNLINNTLPDDYNLSELCENSVEVKIFKGNHFTILENTELAEDINNAMIYGTECTSIL